MTRLQPILALSITLALTGCATAPPRAGAENPEAAWARRQALLSEQDTWRLNGKVAVAQADEGWNAGIRWHQVGGHIYIDLSGPLGRTVARIRGDSERVTLTTRDGETRSAASPERLMTALLGWRVPLTGLRYWVLGIPEPGAGDAAAERERLDDAGRLASLRQDGWDIEYEAYGDAAGTALPERIALRNGDLRVKVVVNEWHLSADR